MCLKDNDPNSYHGIITSAPMVSDLNMDLDTLSMEDSPIAQPTMYEDDGGAYEDVPTMSEIDKTYVVLVVEGDLVAHPTEMSQNVKKDQLDQARLQSGKRTLWLQEEKRSPIASTRFQTMLIISFFQNYINVV